MLVKRKNISLQEARKISEFYCRDMNIPYCEIYYVDRLEQECILGIYVQISPHILIIEKSENKLTLLLHELIHHIDAYKYTNWEFGRALTHSSKGYILAKNRTITWCKKNISDKIDWKKMLKHKLKEEELKNFKL